MEKISLGEKFFAYTSGIEKGKEFSELFPKGDTVFLDRKKINDSDSDEHAVYEKLLEEESFDEKGLIATKILDCGVNIRCRNIVKNIVILAVDYEDIIQAVGRVRLEPDFASEICVYVQRPSLNVIRTKHNALKTELNELRTNQEAAREQPTQLLDRLPKHAFMQSEETDGITKYTVQFNNLVAVNIKNKLRTYERFLGQNTKTDSYPKCEFNFQCENCPKEKSCAEKEVLDERRTTVTKSKYHDIFREYLAELFDKEPSEIVELQEALLLERKDRELLAKSQREQLIAGLSDLIFGAINDAEIENLNCGEKVLMPDNMRDNVASWLKDNAKEFSLVMVEDNGKLKCVADIKDFGSKKINIILRQLLGYEFILNGSLYLRKTEVKAD